MISLNEVERLRREAAQVSRYSIQLTIGLSLICSLSAVAIISKTNLTNYLWLDLAAFALPIPIALYFRKRIALLGLRAYIVVLVLVFGAAVVFGI